MQTTATQHTLMRRRNNAPPVVIPIKKDFDTDSDVTETAIDTGSDVS